MGEVSVEAIIGKLKSLTDVKLLQNREFWYKYP